MKRYFLLLLLSFSLCGEEFPLAPLMPLIPGDPLELNLKLRERLYEEDQSARNVAIFESYHFPWLPSLAVILVMSGAPLMLYLWQETMRKIRSEEIPTFREILLHLKELDPKGYSPRELSFEVAKLFKMGFENGPSMTYQELNEQLSSSQRFSAEQIVVFQKQFEELEKMQYQAEEPSREQVYQTIDRVERLLT